MLGRLFPKQLGTDYRGSVLAIWLLVPLALVKVLQGANVAGRGRDILESVDRVPVSSFPAEAASHLVFLFSAWGLCVLLLGSIGFIASVRYRAMIPLAFLLLLIEQFGRTLLSVVYLDRPFFPTNVSPAALINWAFLAAAVVGFLLSLWPSKRPPQPTPAT
jgi:hypothetical protein